MKIRSAGWREENDERYRELIKERDGKPESRLRRRESGRKRRASGKIRRWQRNNPDKIKLYNRKRQHKEHQITLKEWDACRLYFNYRCAYCGITWEDHKKLTKQDFHKEHVDHEGSNDLSNCVPSCRRCNSMKNTFTLDEWYNQNNEYFQTERLNKIYKWIYEDYKRYIISK